MNSNNSGALRNAIDSIFTHNKLAEQGTIKKKKQGASKQDIELALTVLLVDLAGCDQEFDPREYRVITSGLRRLFGTTPDQVQALVNQANIVLSNLRGVSRFGELLEQSLEESEKAAIMEVIEEVIAADGQEDGFETYLRNKFAKLLGVTISQEADKAANS